MQNLELIRMFFNKEVNTENKVHPYTALKMGETGKSPEFHSFLKLKPTVRHQHEDQFQGRKK